MKTINKKGEFHNQSFTSLVKSSQTNSQIANISKNNELSIYKDSPLNKKTAVETIAKLKAVFPKLEPMFFNTLLERAKYHNFTNQRFVDAVNNIIDTYEYPEPRIANFINFDKLIEAFSYKELIDLVDKYGIEMDKYSTIDINGIKKFALKTQLEKYNLI